MSSSRPGIITVQLGHYANHVGTHYWNIQDDLFNYEDGNSEFEIRSEHIYREGVGARGQPTYTPRLVLIDKKGSLGSLSREGHMYKSRRGGVEAAQEQLKNGEMWEGGVSQIVHDAAPKNEWLQRLESAENEGDSGAGVGGESATDTPAAAAQSETEATGGVVTDSDVRVWSDYLRAYLHPNSIHELWNVKHGIDSFDAYCDGAAVLRDLYEDDELDTRFHKLIEECDRLEGFQVFVDVDDGFGGLGVDLLTRFADDYSSAAINTFCISRGPVVDPTDLDETARRKQEMVWLNNVCSYTALSELSSLYTPLTPLHLTHECLAPLNYSTQSDYRSSAVLAAAIDTATLPYRLNNRRYDMLNYANMLCLQPGANATLLSTTLPLPLSRTHSLVNVLDGTVPLYRVKGTVNLSGKYDNDLLPRPYTELAVLRGVPDGAVGSSSNHRTGTATDVLIAAATLSDGVVKDALYVNQYLPIAESFPDIFAGLPSPPIVPGPRAPLEGVSMMSHVQTSPAFADALTSLATEFAAVDKGSFFEFEESMNTDSWNDVQDQLLNMRDRYRSD